MSRGRGRSGGRGRGRPDPARPARPGGRRATGRAGPGSRAGRSDRPPPPSVPGRPGPAPTLRSCGPAEGVHDDALDVVTGPCRRRPWAARGPDRAPRRASGRRSASTHRRCASRPAPPLANRIRSTSLLLNAEPVRLGGERLLVRHDRVRVLGGEAGQHGVVAGDRVDLAVLEQRQAAGVVVGADGDRLGLQLHQVVHARRAVGGADRLAGQVGERGGLGAPPDQDLLTGR